MRKRNDILLFSLIATAMYVLISLLQQSIPSHRFLFVYFFLYLVLLPGFLAALRLSPWAKGAVRVLASFIFGTMIAYVTLFVAALFRFDVRVYGFVAPAIVLALSFWKRDSPADSGDAKCTEDLKTRPRIQLSTALLVVLIVAVSIMIMRTGDPLFYTSDSPDHIAYIRTISRTHEAFPDQFYYRDGGILTHDIRKGMGQVLWAPSMLSQAATTSPRSGQLCPSSVPFSSSLLSFSRGSSSSKAHGSASLRQSFSCFSIAGAYKNTI
jgi:hypothetical protein